MSTAVATCQCGSIGADPSVVRLAECHHRYFRGDKQLVSVSKMLAMWPRDPCGECRMPFYGDHVPNCGVKAKIENARERGSEVDRLFAGYINGTLQFIPSGTRLDSCNLLDKLLTWWERQGLQARTQVILADADAAGTCDLLIDGGRVIADLKCTYDVDAVYPLQLGFYGLLALAQGVQAEELWIIHATARYAEPRLIQVPVKEAMGDAAIVRRMYSMVTRRTGKA